MFPFPGQPRSPLRVTLMLTVLVPAVAARPAQARQVLLVGYFNSSTVYEYDATNGATINAAFITLAPPSGGNHPLALDGNNHIFVGTSSSNTVGEYNAITGGGYQRHVY